MGEVESENGRSDALYAILSLGGPNAGEDRQQEAPEEEMRGNITLKHGSASWGPACTPHVPNAAAAGHTSVTKRTYGHTASRMISWVKVLLFPTCRENLALARRSPARVISRGFSTVVSGFLEKEVKAELVPARKIQNPKSGTDFSRVNAQKQESC